MDSILQIPQISHSISVHLRHHDLAQCIRVNKAWHSALIPRLWSLINGHNIQQFQSAEVRDALLKNGRYIRVLKTSSHEFLTYLGSSCNSLTVFDFSGSFPNEGKEEGYGSSSSPLPPTDQSQGQQSEQVLYHEHALDVMAGFLLQNKNLTTLSFRCCVDSRRHLDRLLTEYQLLERLLNLKDLRLTSKTLHSSALAMILRHGHRLERLVVKFRQIDWQIRVSNQEMAAILQESNQPWKLRDLQFGPILGLDIAMVVKAAGPSLESLRLERLSLYEAQGLSQVVRDHCPNLEHLLIMTDNKIDKNGLTLLLDALAPARSSQRKALTQGRDPGTPTKPDSLVQVSPQTGGLFNFQGHALTLPDFLIHRLFGNHYATLDFLDLSRSQGIKSETIQQILCRCPNLRVLDMASEHLTLETKDIVFGEPWICHKLEILQIEIASSPPPFGDAPLISDTAQWTEIEMQRHVLALIGSFTRMQELMIGGSHGRSMELTLGEGGLELLSGLKRMRNMNVKKMGHKIGQRELEWMVEQWPMVRMLMFQGYNTDTIDLGRVVALKTARQGKVA
ncbi:hypothetical protein BGZ59_005411 [Podila verticillata]|nr:hypothetical protein BGZ59_005411 [Podila verticillata]KFH70158.1 hypothetical protein MVEG_04960 [Podila verticillata NRRL 6337]